MSATSGDNLEGEDVALHGELVGELKVFCGDTEDDASGDIELPDTGVLSNNILEFEAITFCRVSSVSLASLALPSSVFGATDPVVDTSWDKQDCDSICQSKCIFWS